MEKRLLLWRAWYEILLSKVNAPIRKISSMRLDFCGCLQSLSWVSIARGCRARKTRSFVYRVRVQHRSAAVDWLCSTATRPSQLKEHSTLKSLCRGTKNRSDLARHAPSSRTATWYRLCEAKQRTLPRAAAARNRYPTLQACADTASHNHLLSKAFLFTIHIFIPFYFVQRHREWDKVFNSKRSGDRLSSISSVASFSFLICCHN
jgi:hypothetical protein